MATVAGDVKTALAVETATSAGQQKQIDHIAEMQVEVTKYMTQHKIDIQQEVNRILIKLETVNKGS